MRISDWRSDVCSSDLPVSSSQTRNSSPPIRDARSTTRRALRTATATPFRTSSPAWWPCTSLTFLKLSRDRKSVVQGKSVSVRVDLGGRRIIKKKKHLNDKHEQ